MTNVKVAGMGERIENRQASGVIQYEGRQGDLVGINADGDVVEADADGTATVKARGVLLGDAHDPDKYVSDAAILTVESEYDLVGQDRKAYFEYGVRVRNTDKDWDFTPGADIYLDVGGGFTEVEPNEADGHLIQKVGYAKPGADFDNEGVANEVVIFIDQSA